MHPQEAAVLEWMAGSFRDIHARRSGTHMDEEHVGVDLLGDRAEVGVVPCWPCLTVDARSRIGSVQRVPTETETIAVEIRRTQRIDTAAFTSIETLGDDAARWTSNEVSCAYGNAEKGAETAHCYAKEDGGDSRYERKWDIIDTEQRGEYGVREGVVM